MVRLMYRTRSMRKVFRRTPGGRTIIHFERRKKSPMKCGRCGAILGGVPIDERDRRRLSKSAKRPQRMFGGILCPRCLAEVIKSVVRGELGI